jgi:hypothetical protein
MRIALFLLLLKVANMMIQTICSMGDSDEAMVVVVPASSATTLLICDRS